MPTGQPSNAARPRSMRRRPAARRFLGRPLNTSRTRSRRTRHKPNFDVPSAPSPPDSSSEEENKESDGHESGVENRDDGDDGQQGGDDEAGDRDDDADVRDDVADVRKADFENGVFYVATTSSEVSLCVISVREAGIRCSWLTRGRLCLHAGIRRGGHHRPCPGSSRR